ncbi:GFA family protein [Sulfitobacter sp. LCG007]
MPTPDLPLHGGCLCGKIRFEVTALPMMTMACHCRDCQKLTSGPCSLSVMVPIDGFSITQGETVRGGLKGPRLDHRFCPDCMNWIFTQFADASGYLNVRATLLDDLSWFRVFVESSTAQKLPWAEIQAVHRYPQFPPAEDRPRLGREFAAWL